MTTAKADEAHSPHETEIRQWLQGFDADPITTLAHIPGNLLHLLRDMNYIRPAILNGSFLTDEGRALIT